MGTKLTDRTNGEGIENVSKYAMARKISWKAPEDQEALFLNCRRKVRNVIQLCDETTDL